MYNYLKAMTEDVKEYIRENIDASNYSDRDEMEEALNDDLWTTDSVTGNASGSYTFDSYQAKEYVFDNIDLLSEMCSEFGTDNSEIGSKFLNEEWEWMDVSIRCYLLGQAIVAALDDMEDELTFEGDEENDD